MAKYTITHSCGHTVEHQIYGSNSKGERDRKIAWLEAHVCSECYKVEKMEKAAQTNSDANMAELEGSPKQIAWAEDIRNKILPAIAEMQKKIDEGKGTSELYIKQRDAMQAAINEVRGQSSAKWWIDHRDERFDAGWLMNIAKGKM